MIVLSFMNCLLSKTKFHNLFVAMLSKFYRFKNIMPFKVIKLSVHIFAQINVQLRLLHKLGFVGLCFGFWVNMWQLIKMFMCSYKKGIEKQ